MTIYQDSMFTFKDQLFKAAIAENESQLRKWGIQKRTLPEWALFLTEEVGELAKAIAEFTYRTGKPIEIFNEAIQTATLALKIAEMVMVQEDLSK